jgi:hypothetical protein
MKNNMNSGWIEYREEEKYLDNIKRFNKRLDEEGIIGIDKLVMITRCTYDLASQCNLKAI